MYSDVYKMYMEFNSGLTPSSEYVGGSGENLFSHQILNTLSFLAKSDIAHGFLSPF